MRSPADEEIEKIAQAHIALVCCDPLSEAPPMIAASGVVNASGKNPVANVHARELSACWLQTLLASEPRIKSEQHFAGPST